MNGPLASQVDDYRPRSEQLSMARAVQSALDENGKLFVEAGTGTGKTFAYLVPALMSARQVVISTGTRTLQDQLFNRDIPLVAGALGRPGKVALLKGRANYLCLHRLETAGIDPGLPAAQRKHLAHIQRWASATAGGDISEVTDVPERSAIWPKVTSTAENCLGQACEFFEKCHVVRARREAQAADVVVVNHHLLMADLTLKESGFGELLPGADALIIDEAHQLPDTAAMFFGVSLGSRRVAELARDLMVESAPFAQAKQVREAADKLDQALRKLRLALGRSTGRKNLDSGQSKVSSALRSLSKCLSDCDAAMGDLSLHASKGLESCRRRINDCLEQLAFLEDDDPAAGLRWAEVAARTFTLNLTPFDVARELGVLVGADNCAWIFTSATLAVGDDFDHFRSRVGVADASSLRLDSPFDFASQSRIYLPNSMPEPSDPDYTACVIKAALPLIRASHGSAFLLFTSHRALKEAALLLADSLDYPLLVQGHAPREELLTRFRALGNAVLLGTSSFWQGVDVRGPALSLVVIDKLPFASPGDPLQQARIESIRRDGGNPFTDFQLPQAVLALKQGVGRLIRDHRDSGVAMLCDPRLESKAYGRLFLKSLPPMQHTRSEAEARAFLASRRHIDNGGAAA
ncbi:MAG: ATP-dependent DNA helicase [Gammaproteobacteria bacterium]|nr:ATP-dependent DNA helicase [Gammaproteobacteria bacterium]